ncbi:IPT/TIG domain-containing protein [Cytophagaceae bacterium DM2B3-1]|uniref:IPT/TIG domain-containing protein n=1 Tax=Xanthocytophaga flava TaxID=3048013 RepID=A0ABT7CN53_9BACT|nr:IPT/TIG domain-containing protein [Xanthocytophaga flavus]MDJ1495146.1 IPT/TIG domain-containing protein [Xanthocytophaga flavus]
MKQLRNLLLLVLLAIGTFACKNDDPEEVLSIASITPQQGTVGTEVTITGTKFSATAADNVVKFDGITAAIKSATSSKLVVIVPEGTTAGKITVTVSGQTVNSASSFTVSTRTEANVSDLADNVATNGYEIKTNKTLTADKVWLLKGFVYVTSGATLTIEPGTIIKGVKGVQSVPDANGGVTGSTASSGTLVIEAGGKINAVGTAEKPIVFTSSKDAGTRSYGDWGGVVLIGKSPTNQPNLGFEGGIRGTYGNYTDAADNSGTLQYVRIEFAGTPLSTKSNSEINGLTLYGVGSGTTIDHIQVSYSGDDSYEWFGGTVAAKYLVAFRGWDDDFDTDHGFSGKVQYGVSLRDPKIADQSKSNGFESDNDGNSSTLTPFTSGIFANISVFVTDGTPSDATQSGNGGYQAAMHLRRNTSLSVYNSVFVGYPVGLLLDGTKTYNKAITDSLNVKGVVLSNMTTAVKGAGITDTQATTFFNTTAYGNSIVALTDLKLNAANFTLAGPSFLPQSGSPLLTGGAAVPSGFESTSYKGAFNTTDWTATWTNWDPQNTSYK